jgi:hypothetical protein
MTKETYCHRSTTAMVLRRVALCLTGIALMTMTASAQQRYSYLPTASVSDGRFFSIAGAGIFTLGDNQVSFKITSPAAASSVEIGIFDGETGGYWDQGSVPLQYTLYADPTGDATGTTQVGQWSGSSMADNAWYSLTVNNAAAAKGTTGDYFYVLRVKSTDPSQFSWSSFKIRTNGTLAGLRNTAFAYTAPLGNANDASVIYPSWPDMTGARYDGNWAFFLDVRTPQTSLTLWDGDMDRGSYDCSDNDTDDPDTPNDSVPSWAVGSAAVAEGVAGSGVACTDAGGAPTTGMTTSNPPDDSRIPALRRGAGVSYEVVSPNGAHFANTNPSGNLEWEQFRIDVAPFNRNTMDYHADSLPAGVYRLQIAGVDMSNLNAWRFPFDFLGVDTNGTPIIPPDPELINGSISGTIFMDGDNNGTQSVGEPGIPNVKVKLAADYNNDGVTDNNAQMVSDNNGKYRFTGLRTGKYTVTVDTTSFSSPMAPTFDADGVATPNRATVTLTAASTTKTMDFGYIPYCAPGAATRGYWRNHPSDWPVQYLCLGGRTYTKTECLSILAHATAGDRTYSLCAQLISTKLNLLCGNRANPVGGSVAAADDWLHDNPVGQGCSTREWNSISLCHSKLDSYNSGELSVPSREDVDCLPAPPPTHTCHYNRDEDDDDGYHMYHNCRRHDHRDDDDDDDNYGHCHVH